MHSYSFSHRSKDQTTERKNHHDKSIVEENRVMTKRMNFHHRILRASVIQLLPFLFAIVSSVWADQPENLDQIFLRKLRLLSVVWNHSILEDSSNNYFWQPETLMYKDVTTGSEVWRVTTTPSGVNQTQDISSTHWSANGNRF